MKRNGSKNPHGSTLQEKLFVIVIYSFILVFSMICLLPFWLVVINSFVPEQAILANGFSIFPSKFTTYSYEFLASGKQIYRSFGISFLVTGAGTVLAVLVTSMFAYGLAHRKLKHHKVFSFITYFTMIFGVGLVGFYILVTNWLGLKDSIWAMILPYLLNPFYAFVLVSFYRTVPYEFQEAATVDGANDMLIFFRIIVPVAAPALATVSMFYAIQYWNDWYLALLFIDDYRLHPLQIMIRQLTSNIDAQKYISGSATNYNISVPTYGLQLASVCVTIGPIIFLYPFLQKYYVKGLTVGSVKG